ncbi:MAG: (2Fe-2S) ferredoxin domain-containing protein, partial [Methanobacterium paludis]|nr:(2Fe-2S) ferredoxin domain-containing protein [Methanobacterium paludis]
MNFNELLKQSKEEYNLLWECKTPVILVGSATCGRSAGAREVSAAFEEELEKKNIPCDTFEVGCIGLCYTEPIVTIIKKGQPAIFYGNVTPKMAKELVESYIVG